MAVQRKQWVRAIIRQAGLSVNEFVGLLQQIGN